MRHTGGQTILVVEDERIVAKELQRTLTNLGYRVPATGATADDAIRLAARLDPALVLLDIQLKGDRDGIQTAEVLRFRFDIPVIFLTAYADEQTLTRAKHAEPHGYLVKPVKDADLLSAIEIVLHKNEVERRHRDRERWLSSTLQSTGEAAIGTNAAGAITFMNLGAELLTAVREEQVVGRPLVEVIALVDEQTRRPIEDPIARVLASGKVVPLPERVMLASGGRPRAIDGLASPIVDGNHHITGATLVFREIVGALQPPSPPSPPRDERRERVEISKVLALAVEMAGAALWPRARVVVELGRLPPVEASEAQLGQAFANLLRNAAEAIEEGHPERNEVRVSATVDDVGRVVVAVRDTGRGMAPEVRRRALEPVFTTKPVGQSTGLGLAVALEIVRASGGDILVETEAGGGSTFRVILPAAGQAAE